MNLGKVIGICITTILALQVGLELRGTTGTSTSLNTNFFIKEENKTEEVSYKTNFEEYREQFDWSTNSIGVCIDDARVDSLGMASYVSGRLIIYNGLKEKYDYVQIQIPMYNDEGSYLGTALANVNNLKKGETWAFEAVFIGKATNYKSSDIEVSSY